MAKERKKRIVVGVSGASGIPIAAALLKAIVENPRLESHLVLTRGGALTADCEMEPGEPPITRLAHRVYAEEDIGAAIASGTFRTAGMAVVPCSMKTAAGIACGYADNLLLRAADVTLKERRPLVLVARECPLSAVHLRNLLELARMGVIILPPVLTFYHRPQGIADMVGHIVGRILDCFGEAPSTLCRWGEVDSDV